MHKVLLTGITGFAGSQIAEKLIAEGIHIIGLKRTGSDTWRCDEFADKIDWVDIEPGYQKILIQKGPDTIIHSAWIGVSSEDRENWSKQIKNIDFLVELLIIAEKVQLKKFIFLGSQAEYGYIDNKVSEENLAIATNAYGSVKLACLEILKTFTGLHNITWVWLRIFSLFGEKEDVNWLIPSVIHKMTVSNNMDFTPGDQKYAYLYIKDFSRIVYKLINQNVASGIYNVSSDQVKTLKSVIEALRNIVNPAFKMNFGSIPYRSKQSMHIEGDITKLTQQIGIINFTDFNVALLNTVNYYLNKKEIK
jgi:UDP-glucose 4-epimerase